MDVIVDKDHKQVHLGTDPDASPVTQLQIAICPPEMEPMQQVMDGGPADATYIIQGYVANGLLARGHNLTFVAPFDLDKVVCTDDLQKPTIAPQSWSASRWFGLASKGCWRLQSLLGVPYLNVFSSYSRYDAYLQCLPGHDVVYERNGLYNVGVAMACNRLNLPYVLFVEADEILEHDIMGKPLTGLLRWRAKRILHYNLHAADCIICVSEQSKGHLVANWDVPANKITVFPNAVDIKRFRPRPESRAEVRASLKVYDSPLIIFVGNFYEWHDVSTLLDSFAQVINTYPDARLLLVGDGEQRQSMAQHAADLGIGHAVQFTGFVSHAEVPRLMSAADIAVVPYPNLDQDLWLSPLKLFEYMASGAAIIASAVGQVASVIQDGGNGLLVPPGDATAMASASKRLISDPDLRARLGRQAREYAVQNHSWEQYLQRLERLLAAVTSGEPVDAL